jgi:hypothetical protein
LNSTVDTPATTITENATARVVPGSTSSQVYIAKAAMNVSTSIPAAPTPMRRARERNALDAEAST